MFPITLAPPPHPSATPLILPLNHLNLELQLILEYPLTLESPSNPGVTQEFHLSIKSPSHSGVPITHWSFLHTL